MQGYCCCIVLHMYLTEREGGVRLGVMMAFPSAGAFVGPDGKTLPVPENLPNAHMRLFGGAQYHRAMAEFRAGIGQLTCPDISREEIVNACGIDDFHDGVNYTRTACGEASQGLQCL